ncbi:MAG: acyl-CoA dehydrogenase family protein [Gammaproteobacteria bacterium]
MIQLELPEHLQQASDNAHLAAEHFFRPLSRKYDRAEHQEPVELKEFGRVTQKAMEKTSAQVDKVDKVDKKTPAPAASKETSSNKNGRNMLTVLAVEQLCWGDVGLMLARPGQGLGNAAVAAVGSDDQRAKWGSQFVAMAITEPQAGSDSKNIATTAVQKEDHWVLNGEKIFVTDGARCEAVVVWATVDKKLGKSGIRSFIVPTGTPGMEVTRLEHKLGIRASDTASIQFTDCTVPLNQLLGSAPEQKNKAESAKGFGGVMQTFDNTRPIVAAMAVGCARAALEMTRELLESEGISLDYNRASANQSSISDQLLEMEADWEAARLLTLKAAWMMDNKKPNSMEASMAKAKAGRTATDICLKCVSLCGITAYSEQHLLEKFARDAKILDIFEGTQQIQQLVIARRLLKRSSQELK